MSESEQQDQCRKDDRQFYYDLTKFEVQAIAQRNQIFLAFQSIMFVAMSVSVGKSELFFPLELLIFIGIVASIMWFYLNWLTHSVECKAMAELEAIDHRVVLVLSARKKHWLLSIGSVSGIVSFGFPGLMLFSWCVVLGYYWCAT
ncbi:hypothetical protein [Rheinheimera pacifica]|uniref:RipA family octameric membrane protein n=1 Tax=Rheinheimera pacifica TaxID=173990 RepID=UPI002ED95D3B